MTALNTSPAATLDVAGAVRDRYSAAAEQAEAALCCPVDYDAQYLRIIPDEILEKDYGCGDPSKWVQPGDRVLDLGSGGGKICYIAAQVVGAEGSVIGVDVNDEMLAMARRHRPAIAETLGYDNVSFRRGRIQDLGLDLDRLDAVLAQQPAVDAAAWLQLLAETDRLRREAPMIPDGSVDVVVSNCVLNLVAEDDRRQLFAEIARVLAPGGRAVISDIVADQEVPAHLKADAELWSGCLSGAFEEAAFLRAFEEAGLAGVELVARQSEAWQVIEGITFRSATVRAWKPLGTTTPDPDAADGTEVIYRGPWAAVMDETGLELVRGERHPVTRAQAARLSGQPFAGHLVQIAADGQSVAGEPVELLPMLGDCCGDTGCC